MWWVEDRVNAGIKYSLVGRATVHSLTTDPIMMMLSLFTALAMS